MGKKTTTEDKKIAICLATYNGSKWIGAFLESLEAQSYKNWCLYVADDYSEDGTVDLIKLHFANAPEKLIFAKKAEKTRGVIKNFQDAINATSDKYILLADQDDVWHSEKIEKLYSCIKNIDDNGAIPALVFSDLEMTDEKLNKTNDSWWRHESVDPDRAKVFKNLLFQNIVPGCSMMLNRNLAKLGLPFPEETIMHDWWLLIICSLFGKVEYLNEKLVRYRRHADAHTYYDNTGWNLKSFTRLLKYESNRKLYKATIQQVTALESIVKKQAQVNHAYVQSQQILAEYIEAAEASWLKKRWLWFKNGIRLTSKIQTIKLYLLM